MNTNTCCGKWWQWSGGTRRTKNKADGGTLFYVSLSGWCCLCWRGYCTGCHRWPAAVWRAGIGRVQASFRHTAQSQAPPAAVCVPSQRTRAHISERTHNCQLCLLLESCPSSLWSHIHRRAAQCMIQIFMPLVFCQQEIVVTRLTFCSLGDPTSPAEPILDTEKIVHWNNPGTGSRLLCKDSKNIHHADFTKKSRVRPICSADPKVPLSFF